MRHLITTGLLALLPTLSFAHTASPFLLPEVFDSKSDSVSFQSGITVENSLSQVEILKPAIKSQRLKVKLNLSMQQLNSKSLISLNSI